MKSKVARYVFIIGSLYYIIAEAISATFFNASIFNTYIFHTISELGIPNGNSPLFWLMNSAFILNVKEYSDLCRSEMNFTKNGLS